MKKLLAVSLVLASLAIDVHAARARVVRRGPHVTRVRVNVVRPRPVVRVTPRVYLGAVAFGAVVVASLPPANARVWTSVETLQRRDGWTDFTLNVDHRGTRLLLDIEDGTAQISYAEVVFDNGEAQVVDFKDGVHRKGLYSLLDFRDGRKVDHVRMVAKANSNRAEIRLHLVS